MTKLSKNASEVHSELNSLRQIYQIFIMRSGSPSVIAANSHLPQRSTDDCIMSLRQFIAMRSVFQLVRRPGQGRKVHRIPCKAQSSAAIVDHLRPSHAASVALLGHPVSRQILPNTALPNAQPSPFVEIDVVLFRPQAIPAKPIIIRIHFHHDAELRHF